MLGKEANNVISTPVTTEVSTLSVGGMHCASCAASVEGALRKTHGVLDAHVNLAAERARIIYDPTATSPSTLSEVITAVGYSSTPFSSGNIRASKSDPDTDIRNLLLAISLAVPILMVSMFWMSRPAWIDAATAIASGIVVFYCGKSIFSGAWNALSHGGRSTMDSLIALGSGTAYIYSMVQLLSSSHPVMYFDTSSTIVTFILLGRWLEGRARQRALDSLQDLHEAAPRTARLITTFTEKNISTDDLAVGDRVRVRAGEKVAADGVVIEGKSGIDQSLITGESIPIEKEPGDQVIGGSQNMSGSIVFEVTAIGNDTILSHIVQQVEDAQGSKAPVQRLADRVSSIFVPVVLIIAGITLAFWLGLAHVSLSIAISHMVGVLVIACPCALGLATPTAIIVSIGRAARIGIVVKDGETLQRLESIDRVVFDKTGTLTEQRTTVTEVLPFLGQSANEVLRLAAAVELGSDHPHGLAIVSEAERLKLDLKAERFLNIPGSGVEAFVDGRRVVVGKRELMSREAVAFDIPARQPGIGQTNVYVAVDGVPIGTISMGSSLRAEASRTVSLLQSIGIKSSLLTGDSAASAATIGSLAGILDIQADLSPSDKSEAVKHLQSCGEHIAMVGDGINDGPALAQAEVGIAMGKASDLAINAAEVTLLKEDLLAVPLIIQLSRRTMQVIRQNLAWAFAFNAIGIPLAATGLLSPMFAAFAMAGSSVLVVTNSLRLRTISLR